MTGATSALSINQFSKIAARASSKTGVDFDYLISTAQRESSLNTQAKSTTSSAAGLFQFVEQTWLEMVQKHGDKYGMAVESGAIERAANGRLSVDDPAQRSAILALRHDPEKATFLAAEYTGEMKTYLEDRLGRPAEGGDLYLAHFFGPSSAARFLEKMDTSPTQVAAPHFKAAANANRSVFFDGQGKPRDLQQVYDRLVNQHNGKSQTSRPSAPNLQMSRPVTQSYQVTSAAKTPAPTITFSPVPHANRLTPQVIEILSMLDPLEVGKKDDPSKDKKDTQPKLA